MISNEVTMTTANGAPKVLFGLLLMLLLLLQGCFSSGSLYVNPDMDFGMVQRVAVMPLTNLARDAQAGDRIRDNFSNMLLATGEIYVLPAGEVARGIAAAGIANPLAPNADEVIKFCKATKVDAVITGVVREYGEIRSGQAAANVISLSMQMLEGQTGTIIWSASSTKGGVSLKDRLLGGGGEPLNVITEKALHEIIGKLLG
jgi:hypothetical protein